VQAHQGRIEVESTPGKGTKIAVFFPLTETDSL
jgi:signal transduction histidine kinase